METRTSLSYKKKTVQNRIQISSFIKFSSKDRLICGFNLRTQIPGWNLY